MNREGGGIKGGKKEGIFSLSSSTTPFTRDVHVRCISCRCEEPSDAGGGLGGARIGADSNCGKPTWSSADACTLTSPFLASGRTVVPWYLHWERRGRGSDWNRGSWVRKRSRGQGVASTWRWFAPAGRAWASSSAAAVQIDFAAKRSRSTPMQSQRPTLPALNSIALDDPPLPWRKFWASAPRSDSFILPRWGGAGGVGCVLG